MADIEAYAPARSPAVAAARSRGYPRSADPIRPAQ